MLRTLIAHQRQCFTVLLFFVLLSGQQNVCAEKTLIQDVLGKGKIRVDSFNDKTFPSVSCHLVQSIMPGFVRSLGDGERIYAIDISCSSTQLPSLSFSVQRRHNGEEVYLRETTSSRHALVVKRYIDAEAHKLVYVLYNNKITGDAPLVAISTVYFTDK